MALLCTTVLGTLLAYSDRCLLGLRSHSWLLHVVFNRMGDATLIIYAYSVFLSHELCWLLTVFWWGAWVGPSHVSKQVGRFLRRSVCVIILCL